MDDEAATPPEPGASDAGEPEGGDPDAPPEQETRDDTPPDPEPEPTVEDTATDIGGTAASAAVSGSQVIQAIDKFEAHVFESGTAGLTDAVKVVDAAQTHVSNALDAVTAKITGSAVGAEPVSALGPAGTLSAEGQKAAVGLLDTLQRFSHDISSLAEEGVHDALDVVNAAQTRVSKLLSSITSKTQQVVGKPGL